MPNDDDNALDIRKDIFEKLCALQCDLKEIAGAFSCSEEVIKKWCKDTYNKSFEEVYKKKSTKGKISLRSIQFKLAEKSPAMAIYLGKIYLNQKEKENEGDKNVL